MKKNNILQNQQLASNPEYSIWVAASAGSGKTTVLVNRLIRLLLSGICPSKILCITFTKTAAAEMRNRINSGLLNWVSVDEEKLIRQLEKLTGAKPDKETILNARTLFAKVVDRMDELKIMTIHSFCQQLLKKFPLEAGIVPNFEVIDEIQSQELLLDARKQLILNTSNTLVQDAIKTIAIQTNELGFIDLLSEFLNKRDNILYGLDHYGLDGLIKNILQELNISSDEKSENIIEDFVNEFDDYKDELKKALEVIMENEEEKIKEHFSITFPIWLNASRIEKKLIIKDYVLLYLTLRDQPRKTLITKKFAEKFPEIAESLHEEQTRVFLFSEKLKSLKISQLTQSLLIVGNEILNIYKNLKISNGLLDYNDLILLTNKLLTSSGNAAWISYKLDQGIDHLLLDEAQDTSPYQWQIVNTIASEFFSGLGRTEDKRTLFIVGDEKQSIFGFQGAEPKMFNTVHNYYKEITENNNFKTIALENSFRSLPNILKFVDKVFEDPERKNAISFSENNIQHNAIRSDYPGKVELWPLFKNTEEKKEESGWQLYFEQDIELTNIEKLANHIAETIQDWIENKKLIQDVKGKVRVLKYSDIMILLKNRTNNLINYLIRAFNKYKIPVAGADRMVLTQEILIQDLIALANFTLFPNDNLNLANIIKSPILNLNEEDLFKLSTYRNEKTLWESLKENTDYSETFEYLSDLIEKSKELTPYEFFFYILETQNGREKIVSRFTETAHDLLDEFLSVATSFEEKHTAALNDFIYYLNNNLIQIKRDMEEVGNEIRIMTIHASKGLQAPVVILPDTFHSSQRISKSPRILWKEHNDILLPFWNGDMENNNELILELKDNEKAEDYKEYLRLLYVALTRARDELYIAGWDISKANKDSWYNVLSESIKEIGQEKENGFIFGKNISGKIDIIEKEEQENLDEIQKLLEEFKSTTDLPKQVLKIINPSQLYSHTNNDITPTRIPLQIIKGQAVHKLLEILPNSEGQDREKIANYYLENSFNELNKTEKEKIKNNVLNILNNEPFKYFFTETSKAEVPIVGEIDGNIISGTIDRLVIEENKIIIIDYKNTEKLPKAENDIPINYREQLKLYKQIIEKIYPDKTIECYILWTSFCELTKIKI